MRAFIFCTTLLLCSCTVGPRYNPPTVSLPSHFKEAPAGWKFAEPSDEKVRGEWWQIFNDPQLNELENKLKNANQNIKAAFYQYQQAIALVAQAKAGYFPVVSSNANVSRAQATSSSSQTGSDRSNSSNRTSNDINLQFTTSWAPDLFGSIRKAVEASQAQAQLTQAQLAATTLLLQSQLAQYYFELRALDNDQLILNKAVKAYRKLLSIVENQYTQGIVARSNILQAQNNLALSEAAALDNQIARAQYEHAIAILVGEAPAAFSLKEQKTSLMSPDILLEQPSTLLERRPDIAAAERQVAATNAQIGVNISAYFPILTLTGIGGVNNNSFHHLFSTPAQFWSLGGELLETLFDGGLRNANVKAACAAYKQAVANYRQTVLTAFQEVEDNLASLKILTEETAKQTEAFNAMQATLVIMQNQYAAGTLALSDVLNTEVALYATEQTLNDLKRRHMVSAISLIQALGGGWEQNTLKDPT